ncbi:hypothetical protein OAF34_03885 [Pirellulaceae bacterium]|jgi:hypothetical protein|nr:hypothetical protein [Pirellulaceae bacterium]
MHTWSLREETRDHGAGLVNDSQVFTISDFRFGGSVFLIAGSGVVALP